MHYLVDNDFFNNANYYVFNIFSFLVDIIYYTRAHIFQKEYFSIEQCFFYILKLFIAVQKLKNDFKQIAEWCVLIINFRIIYLLFLSLSLLNFSLSLRVPHILISLEHTSLDLTNCKIYINYFLH